jgi:capsid protein
LILSGIVKAPDFEENKDLYLQREVNFQPFEYIQPLQDAEADQVKLNSKIYTLEEMLDGRDVEEHIAQLGKEAKLADKYGITLFQKELKVVNVGGELIDDTGDKIPME